MGECFSVKPLLAKDDPVPVMICSRGTQPTQAGGQDAKERERPEGELGEAGRRRQPHHALPDLIQTRE